MKTVDITAMEMASVQSRSGITEKSIRWIRKRPVLCTKKLEVIVRMCLVIITEIFRKDYTSIKNCHVAHDLYSCAITSNSRRTADGCCEPSARERREHVARVLPDETNKQHTKERCGISSHRVKNLFRFYNHCLGSCDFVRII